MTIKVCPICNEVFSSPDNNNGRKQIYCTPKCRNRMAYLKYKLNENPKPERNYSFFKICPECNKEFKKSYFYQRLCDDCRKIHRLKNHPLRLCLFCKQPLQRSLGSKFCNDTCYLNYELTMYRERNIKLGLIKVCV